MEPMSRRLAPRCLLVLALVVCAGCVSPQAPQTPTAASTSPPTTDAPATGATTTTLTTAERPSGPATSTVRTDYATDCPYSLQVDVATDAQRSRIDRVVAYSALSPARQREFDAARANGSTELGDTLPETWAGPRIVSYQREQYYAVASVC